MFKHNNNYGNYLIDKIKLSVNNEREAFPHKQEFRLALHEIYFSRDFKKIGEIANTLTLYHIKKEKFKNYLEAFEKSLIELNSFSESADKFYNLQNKEIQEFCKNSIEDVCTKFN